MQIAQVCMYIHTHGVLPRLQTTNGLAIASEQNRAQLVEALSAFVRAHELVGLGPGKKLEIIVLATEFAAKRRLSDVDDGALLLATIINMSDVIAYDQRTRYADNPSMREMVDNLTGLLAPVMTRIFGDALPDDVQRAWPDFARLFGARELSIH